MGLFPADESTVAVAELNPGSWHRGEIAREGMQLTAPHHPGSLHGDGMKNLKTLSFCIATQPQLRMGTGEGRRGERQHQEKQQQVEKKAPGETTVWEIRSGSVRFSRDRGARPNYMPHTPSTSAWLRFMSLMRRIDLIIAAM